MCSLIIGYTHTGRKNNFVDKTLEKFDTLAKKNNLGRNNNLNERLLEEASI